jgi:hypothetical protein
MGNDILRAGNKCSFVLCSSKIKNFSSSPSCTSNMVFFRRGEREVLSCISELFVYKSKLKFHKILLLFKLSWDDAIKI